MNTTSLNKSSLWYPNADNKRESVPTALRPFGPYAAREQTDKHADVRQNTSLFARSTFPHFLFDLFAVLLLLFILVLDEVLG